MLNQNATKEGILIESIISPLAYAKKAQTLLKEKYGLDGIFNEETYEFSINTNNINESLDAALAKKEIEQDPELRFMEVVYNKF